MKEIALEENVLGTWMMAAHDTDPNVRIQASSSWKAYHGDNNCASMSFISRVILDPAGVYADLNPVQGVNPPPTQAAESASARDHDEEDEKDRSARLRTSAIGVLSQILGKFYL